jgi:uncharacterized membrane protein
VSAPDVESISVPPVAARSTIDVELQESVDTEPVARRRSPGLTDRARTAQPATWVLAAMVVGYTWYFTERTLDIHHGLGTAAYDSGLYDQGVWLLSRFESPFVTLMGRNLFGDHASFILILLVPFYWMAPGAWILFFSQSAVLAAGAIPVYLYARRRLESAWLGLVLAVAYLLHPAVSWTNMENFHPDSYLGLFVGIALYGALERKWRTYAVGVVLSLLVKEDVSLVIVPLGVWVAVKRDRRLGLLTIGASVWMAIFGMFLVMRSLVGVPTRNTWRIPFGGLGGLIETTLRNPTQLADHLRSDGRLWYLWQMTSPVAFMFKRAWSVAAISALVLFTNILSTYWYQYHIQYHYSVVAVPAIVFGTAYALGTVPNTGRWNRTISVGAVGVASVLAAYTWAPFPFAHANPSFWPPDHPVAIEARDIVSGIPDDAVVSAHYRIAAHLTYRKEIYQFPNPFRIVLYGPDTSREGQREVVRADGVDYLVLQVSKSEEDSRDFEEIRPAFTRVRANASWELWQRDRSVPLPPRALPGE